MEIQRRREIVGIDETLFPKENKRGEKQTTLEND